ncbi:MAG TPA: YebC/PmpR family DNA-binding transcriptional regulator [Candidatus Obscuribacter sp.]|nr:YebC/PmpR family DNA-binding transcriptional regulator [Candidatus Obscuribacter sp.]MBK9277137.1 YebC/PmpR family DNA-binding transcriptional regulator [Candidatus Obscuribacter sp.]MBL8081506.1 YebC/PmpR family DNA-binding transcriptional regulator [Candidatus Obscuribacter sp.]HNB16392.1 YebC/PmpR family DNA-binding transcriptional regulator [Candidatus Obscuribacter sp.]HND68863.1 YebC/PmpR family DNA-binding transcriptional regulator [Candidatus Obscuribacter sp.]
MSGHSKWANIKRTKAVVDAKKAVVYAKMSREIIVAAKLGGGDPSANFRLRQAIDRAKAGGVPNDNIQRAIEKGTGAGNLDNFEELVYEGYGPGGVAVMVKCTTDNRNRTAGDVRSYFSKFGGNLGESGCVNWMFKERGEVVVNRKKNFDEDAFLLEALDAGADDVDTSEEELLVICQTDKLEDVQNKLSRLGYAVSSAQANLIPLSTVEITSKDTAKLLLKLLDNLENHDDVQNVFANFEMDQDWMSEYLN